MTEKRILLKPQVSEITSYMEKVGRNAKKAARVLATAPTATKNAALKKIAQLLLDGQYDLKIQNARDLETATANGFDNALLDRLELTDGRINAMAEGLIQVSTLVDPVGELTNMQYQPSGIQVGKMRVPLGVIGVIYESRPNVTSDAAGLSLKAGNATILRGGSEALYSNQAIASCVHKGLVAVGLPEYSVQVINTIDRAAVGELIRMNDYVDVIVPRGGKGLTDRISREATVPVIKHLDGICHVFIDDEADPNKAIDIAYNAKTNRYGTCCTMETLLIGANIAKRVLPQLAKLYDSQGVELRGCARTQAAIPNIKPAVSADWDTEYLAPILSIRIVDDLDQAISHIEQHGSRHTDAIVTTNLDKANRFIREIDSSSVMVNASTRFADGFEYGLGAEIGISTNKLHARGPVALEGLTSQKFVVFGDGHVRQ